MSRYQRRAGYIVALLTTLVVLAARMALERVLGDQARLLPFLLAVIAAAWWGGLRPGLLATFLGAFLGVLYVVPPSDSLILERVADGLNAVLFVIVGVTISAMFEKLNTVYRSEAEKQFRTLADSVAQLVWMAHPDGRRFWFNQRWYEYTGTTLRDVEGERWQALCEPNDLPNVLQSWHTSLAGAAPWEATYRLRGKDGRMRWFLARAVPIYNALGELVRWCGTSTDIDDQIQTEQALREADVRKDQYLATLAHELRNPLSPITSALSLWPRVANNTNELERLRGVIERQVKQLVRLIDDLLDVARFSRGKIVLRKQPINLAAVIQAAVESIQPLVEAGRHQLALAIPHEPVYVSADSARLTQVFANILNNAAKYTVRKGSIAVSLETSGGEAAVRIRDDGPGIPGPMLNKIFEPFVQINRTVDSSQGGLGIGLTLVRQLVTLHGGSIEARSAGPGKGSEFLVTLPILVTLPAELPDLHLESISQVASSVAPLRVLVVDDFDESAELLASLVRKLGHSATAIDKPGEAIEWILAHHPDLVLLDIAMPGLDGYEIARRLREHCELDDVVLVALTGYGQEHDRRRSLDGGFNFHLIKPVSAEALAKLLNGLSATTDAAEVAAVS